MISIKPERELFRTSEDIVEVLYSYRLANGQVLPQPNITERYSRRRASRELQRAENELEKWGNEQWVAEEIARQQARCQERVDTLCEVIQKFLPLNTVTKTQ